MPGLHVGDAVGTGRARLVPGSLWVLNVHSRSIGVLPCPHVSSLIRAADALTGGQVRTDHAVPVVVWDVLSTVTNVQPGLGPLVGSQVSAGALTCGDGVRAVSFSSLAGHGCGQTTTVTSSPL